MEEFRAFKCKLGQGWYLDMFLWKSYTLTQTQTHTHSVTLPKSTHLFRLSGTIWSRPVLSDSVLSSGRASEELASPPTQPGADSSPL